MKTGKQDVIEAGRWLARERAKRGDRASTTLIARLSTLIATRNGDPVKIHQQQLSDIENATADKGPAKLQPWWRHVRELIESGELDRVLQSSGQPGEMVPKGDDQEFFIVDSDGKRLGKVVLFRSL